MTKETNLLPDEEIKNIRRLSAAVVENSEVVNVLACYLYDIAKERKKELSLETISSMQVMPIEEAQDVPSDVLEFLKKNMIARGNKKTGSKKLCMSRLIFFVDSTREAILEYLKRPDTTISFRDIGNYAEIFNMQYIKEHLRSTERCSNISRLIIAVALSDNDKQSTFSLNPHIVQHVEFILRLVTEEQMKSLVEVHKIYFN